MRLIDKIRVYWAIRRAAKQIRQFEARNTGLEGVNMRSRKTTVLGILSILSALCGAGVALLDGNPATNVDLPTLIAAITAGVGLIQAKDWNATGVPK